MLDHPRRHALAWTLAAAALLSSGSARADVLPPPVPILNAFLFGPAGIVVLAGIIAVGVLLYRWLRRRGRGKRFAIAAALGVCLALDFAAYLVGVTVVRRSPHERPLPYEGRVAPRVIAPDATTADATTGGSTSSPGTGGDDGR
ncbi:MAG: hypothetical protein KC486_17140 [Myxococcales bacterium]|nr:hypothetical protein [Myxococcales bacterium]